MIKVLQVIGSLNYGGIESVIMNYYRNIDREKVQFDFITTSAGGRFEDEIRSLGGKIFYLPSKSKHPFKYMRGLEKIIRENNYDIVHSNTNSASAYLDLKPAKKAGCKVRIAHSHNSSCLIKWQHRLFKPLLSGVLTHRFACSEAAAKWLFGKNKDYEIINNGIDFDKFAFNVNVRNAVRNEHNWGDSFVIGNVASFQERKNQKFLIEMLPKLVEKLPNIKLVLVGDGNTVDELRELARTLQVSNCVEFMGNRKDVNELLQGFDMFCFPSLFEGLGVAYIEALVSGLTVLISDGVPIVKTKENVYQISLDKNLWINKVFSILDKTNNRHLDRQELIKIGYDIQVNAQSLERKYIEMVNGKA